MARCVRIVDGMVTEELPFRFEERDYWLGGANLSGGLMEAPDYVGINWRYEDGVFSEPEEAAEEEPVAGTAELMERIKELEGMIKAALGDGAVSGEEE